jgi:hypothetical protein
MPEHQAQARRQDGQQQQIVKAIILVTGSDTDGWVLWQAPGGPPVVLPAAATPAGFVPNPGVNCGNAPASAVPYAACETAYKAAPFVAANWRYHPGGQIANLAALQAQLNIVKAWNPAAVVVHYVGHGGFANNITYWSCRGHTIRMVPWTLPSGLTVQVAVPIPTDGVEVAQIDLVQVKAAMVNTFGNIPLTLITDGCEQQRALALGGGGFRVIVCDKVEAPWFLLITVPRIVNEGLFSSHWARAVGPTCFSPDDVPANGRPAAFAAVNAAMALAPAAAQGGPQVADCAPAP